MAGQIVNRGTDTWLVRVYMGQDANGKRKYHNKTIHGNKKDAERYLTKTLRERDLGEFVEPAKDMLKDFLDTWLETAAKPRIAPGTYRSYKDIVECYLKPQLGDKVISKLTAEEIQKTYNAMTEKGLSPRTVRYTHAVLRNALNQAIKWDKLYRNPAERVELPKQKKEEMKVLTPEEAARFMDATVFSPHKALFSLLLSSGMRPGEALGLKWSDVDLKKKKIHVQRALSRTKGAWHLEEPKTPQSRRTIPIPPEVIEDLKEHKKEQAAQKLKAPEGTYTDYGLVFSTKTGEPLDHHNIVVRHFKPLLKDAGLPDIRLYDLRHTCATLLLMAGEHSKVVSERLGHASVTLTLDTYSHVLPDMQEKATEKLTTMLFTGSRTQKRNPHTKEEPAHTRTPYAHTAKK